MKKTLTFSEAEKLLDEAKISAVYFRLLLKWRFTFDFKRTLSKKSKQLLRIAIAANARKIRRYAIIHSFVKNDGMVHGRYNIYAWSLFNCRPKPMGKMFLFLARSFLKRQ